MKSFALIVPLSFDGAVNSQSVRREIGVRLDAEVPRIFL